jgi:hypothetical protein
MAISANGTLGKIHRPGRVEASTACGALIGALAAFKSNPSKMREFELGEHDAIDPEYSILKQLLVKQIEHEIVDPTKMYLADVTDLAERAITAELESMIADTVDCSRADYAVITGIQVHNWPEPTSEEPNLEFVAPRLCYVVVNGERTDIDLVVCPLEYGVRHTMTGNPCIK